MFANCVVSSCALIFAGIDGSWITNEPVTTLALNLFSFAVAFKGLQTALKIIAFFRVIISCASPSPSYDEDDYNHPFRQEEDHPLHRKPIGNDATGAPALYDAAMYQYELSKIKDDNPYCEYALRSCLLLLLLLLLTRPAIRSYTV